MTGMPESHDCSTTQPCLTDSESFGEDLAANLDSVNELAEKYCDSCKGYHVLHVAKRLLPLTGSLSLDRHEIAATVRKLAEEQRVSTRLPLEVVIAGCADTGLLASAAHGIALTGKPALSQTRFTVIDRCRTPLELCLRFARTHDLNIETEIAEIVDDMAPRVADLVLVHSLFRFLPQPSHVDVLRKIGRWLRPGGRIVFSSKLDRDESGKVFEQTQRDFEDDVVQRIRSGELPVGGRAGGFDMTLSRRPSSQTTEYGDLSKLQTLFDLAETPVLTTQIVSGKGREAGKQVTQRRAVVVLGPPSS